MSSKASAAAPKLTPMMRQYRSVKAALPPDTILFFRLGDFYEMFFEDAVRAAEILNITLTGRDAGEAGRVPMCGIPYHAFQGYVRTLLDNQLKVAVCEQIGDPKAAKGLMERRVTRIITPSTFLDDDSGGKTPEYLASIVIDGARCGLAHLEPGTGAFTLRECARERLISELSLAIPRELILSADCADPRLERLAKETFQAAVTRYEPWVFSQEEAQRQIEQAFPHVLQASGLEESPLALRAAGAALYYLRAHLQESLRHIRPPRLMRSEDFMALDRQTVRSLELVRSLQDERRNSVLATLDHTRTAMGGRTLHRWITQPLLAREPIIERQDAVEAFLNHPEILDAAAEHLHGLKDIERTLTRLNTGVANARDLLAIQWIVERIPGLRQLLDPLPGALLKGLRDALQLMPDLAEELARAVQEAPPLTVREGGMIRPGYSPELDDLLDISKNGKQWLADYQRRESERTGIKSLKVRYSGVFGYALEVSKANLGAVPEHYIRRQTLANAERFITPELKAWDEKISGAEDRIKQVEYAIFNELRATVLARLEPLQAMARALGELDCLHALARAAQLQRWTRPEIAEDTSLHIEGGRHPVVERMLPAGGFVPNDAHLDTAQRQLAILTGPNMAGKSTYIRQVALLVLLAQIGSFVPADRARIGLCDRIFTRIGASDNLAGGESTFMVEMIETAHILRNATDRSLLILDEVGRGTSTFDGVSLAWAVCEHLASGPVRPRTLFATHYHELIRLAEHFPGVHNLTMRVKETREGIVFLRKVETGSSDRSYGIHVAQLAGLPEPVTRRAAAILDVLERENSQATAALESGESQLDWFRAAQPQAGPDRAHPVVERLRDLDINGMTPLEALTLLAELKHDSADPEAAR